MFEMSSQRPSIPRGFRDFPPEIMILRKEVLERIERIFKKYGFDPIDTPSVEHYEVLAGKYGEEAERKLMWRFKDPWGNREYALRYDLTVPLARFVAMRKDLPLPFKRYHIAPVWRHEEPQRGRYREFYQCDVDVVGSPYPEADAEVISVVGAVFKEFGLSDYVILVNDRRILRGIFEEELGLKDPMKVYRAIDKLDKLGEGGVRKELLEIGMNETSIRRVMEIISVRGPLEESLSALRKKYGGNENFIRGSEFLIEMKSFLSRSENVIFDMSLVRGLDYYTGPIFEALVRRPKIGSIAGGGRYDDLIEMFTGYKIPSTGFSIGVERLIEAGIELGIFSASRRTYVQAYVIILDRSEGTLNYAIKLIEELREQGINTSWDLMRRSQRKQRDYVRKLSIPITIFIGREEVEKETVSLFSTIKKERKEVPRREAVEAVKAMVQT